MPVVTVELWKGHTPEEKGKIVKGMTQVLVDVGIPAHQTTVIIHESSKGNWGIGGEILP